MTKITLTVMRGVPGGIGYSDVRTLTYVLADPDFVEQVHSSAGLHNCLIHVCFQ